MVSATWLIRYREETRVASGGYDYVSERTTVKAVRFWILKETFGFGNPDRQPSCSGEVEHGSRAYLWNVL